MNDQDHAAGAGRSAEPATEPLSRKTTLRQGVAQEVRDRPCVRCPWRTDTDLTAFSEEEMDMLRQANGRPGADAEITAPTVACHRDQPGTRHAWRWCAGWLATVGHYHHLVRLAGIFESIPKNALDPQPGWPELYPGLDALLAARTEQLARRRTADRDDRA
ncbi:DUF6283 family protein [Streptomyces sp. NPDC006307]|uniref:DUF6283 family protein n=1 Tax=Streptomyces sp. NPDC006307 TaxID=3156748 RepID=UPI0033BDF777